MSDDKSKGGNDPNHEIMTPETLKESLGELASNIDSLVDNLTMEMPDSRPDQAADSAEHPFDELPPDMANVVVAETSDDAPEAVEATEPVGSLEISDDGFTNEDEQDAPMSSLAQMAAAAPSATFESAAEAPEQDAEESVVEVVDTPVDEEVLPIEAESPTESAPEAIATKTDYSIEEDTELVGLAEGLIDSVHTQTRDASGKTRPKEPVAKEAVRQWMDEAKASQSKDEGNSFDVFGSETEQSQEDDLVSAELNEVETAFDIVEAESEIDTESETEPQVEAACDDATPISAENETNAAEIEDELTAEQQSTTAAVIPWAPSEAPAASGGSGALWKLAAALAAVGLLGGGWVVWNGRGDKAVELTELAPPVNRSAQIPASNVILESASKRTDQAGINAAAMVGQSGRTGASEARATEKSAVKQSGNVGPGSSSSPPKSTPTKVAKKTIPETRSASSGTASRNATKPQSSVPTATKAVAHNAATSKPVASKPVASKPIASNSSAGKPTAMSSTPSQNATTPKQTPAPTRPTEVANPSTPVVPRSSVPAPKPTVTDSIALAKKPPVETATQPPASPAPTRTASAQPLPKSPSKTSVTSAPRGNSEPPTPIITEPTLITRGKVEYSERARKRGETGVIELRLLVGTTGRVKRVVVEHGIPGSELEISAINAALRSSYEPASSDGEPVEAWANERFVFEP